MEIYGKSLIFVVFILLILSIVQTLINRNSKNINKQAQEGQKQAEQAEAEQAEAEQAEAEKLVKETFVDKIFNTVITKLDPYEGDSSTIIIVKGAGLDNVGKVIFNEVECAILENRTDSKIEIIPPTLSELGFNISDVRKVMKEKNEGLKVKIQLARRDMDTKLITGNSPEDNSNFVEVPGLFFYYIDRIPYENNCPDPKTNTQAPALQDVVQPITTEPATMDYEKGTDLEFLNKILPKKEVELDKLIGEMNKILKENEEYDTNDITYLNIIQALDSVKKYKAAMNIQRFNIHNTLKDRYGYSF